MHEPGPDATDATPPPDDERPEPPADLTVRAHAQLLEAYLATAPDAVVDILRPLAALDEVIAVCESVGGRRQPPQPHDRSTLRTDVQRALTAIGSELRRELEPTFSSYYHAEMMGIPDLLTSASGGVRLLSATRVLRERIRRPASAQAAWRDLLASVRGGSDVEDTIRLRALQLREVEESLGHEWRWLEMRLLELVRAGEFDDAEEVLSLPPPRSAQVAWFIFANGDIPDGYQRVGQVQFFSHRLWPEAVTSRDFIDRIPEAEFPAELDDWALEQIKPHEEEGHYVYARVELVGPRADGMRNPWAHGRPTHEWARELVSAIVEAATFRLGGSAWKLLSGAAIYGGTIPDESGTFGNWGGSWPFADPDEYDRPVARPLAEGTGEALESLEPRFAELLAEGDATARDAVGEVRWFEATRKQTDPAQRLALHVRAFERALPTPGNERWNDAVKRYFREYWALDRFEREIFELAHQSEWVVRTYRIDELEHLEQWVVHDDELTVFYAAFLRMAARILPLIPQHYRLERRRLRCAINWASDPAAARRQVHEHEQRFDILLDRALRQRNAVVHGVKTVPDVVASVDAFIARVAGYIVAQSVHGAGSSDDLVEAIERGRDHARRTVWRLEQGETPVERVLFGGEE